MTAGQSTAGTARLTARAARTARAAGPCAAGTAALAGVAVLCLLAAGCSTGGTGTRDEGAAVTAPLERGVPTPATSAAPPVKTVDPAWLLRRDPKVSARIKAALKPCPEGAYPVDTSYGNLTGGSVPDVVVNVMTCGDAVGIGTYVYRETDRTYRCVFAVEEPAVYATIDRGELVLTQQVYAKGDPVAYPSGEDVVTYSWSGNRFTERYRVRNNYSSAVGDGAVQAPDGVDPTVPRQN
ncbi:hypothetical protein [Streptomyces liangshanensis]|uniref:hypothetical protein n=1 Tax=Streptomyces liangshanensis TaxID=2717324 RepID=UPI0036D7E1A0